MGALIIGILLVVFQIASYLGNLYAGKSIIFFQNIVNFDAFIWDLGVFIGYNIVGIIGVFCTIIGVRDIIKKKKKSKNIDKKDNESK